MGVLSVSASQPGGLVSLPRAWQWAEEAAEQNGRTVNRDDWRLLLPFHLADSKQEAMADVGAGREQFYETYYQGALGTQPNPAGNSIEAAAERGEVIVGTPDDAIPGN